MLLHIFRTESGAISKAPRIKDYRAQEPRGARRVRGFKWRVPREFTRRGGEPFKPQTVLLRGKASAVANRSGEARHLLCLRSPAVARSYGGQAVLVIVSSSSY